MKIILIILGVRFYTGHSSLTIQFECASAGCNIVSQYWHLYKSKVTATMIMGLFSCQPLSNKVSLNLLNISGLSTSPHLRRMTTTVNPEMLG
jgi:hypothetical protein